MSYFERTQVQASDSPSIDAFSRWRISQPVTLFDGIHSSADAFKGEVYQTGNGTNYTVNSNRASWIFTTTANTAGTIIGQTKHRFKYFPGKSQMILMTFVMGAGIGGNRKRVGYFDDRNGIFLQQDGSEVSLNIRSYATGNAVDTKVVQSSWNLDKLDGTGASGLTLNLSQAQILVIDFQWLGVGRVRIGFDIDGLVVYVHEFLHANETSVVYMSSGNQPIRYELTHNGTGESSSLEVICATAISEGGLEKLGVSGGQIIDVGSVTGNTAIAAFGIKLSDVWNAVVKITSVEVLGTTVNDFFGWALFEDPTVAGTFTYAAPADSAVLFAAGDNTNTVNTVGLRPLKSGLGASQSTLSIPFDDDIQLSSSVNGTAIPLVLVVYPFSNMNMYVALNWRELA